MSAPGFDVVEWEVRGPLDGLPIAIVRLLHLGEHHEPYWRAVTAENDPRRRQLIGYYGSAGDAHDASIHHAEQRAQRSLAGGNRPPSARYVPQKPPPGAVAA